MTKTGRYVWFPRVGMMLSVITCYLLTSMDASWSVTRIVLSLLPMGAGLGLSLQSVVVATQNSVAMTDLASATSSMTFLRTLLGAVAITIVSAIVVDRSKVYMYEDRGYNDSFSRGVGDAMWLLVFMTICGTIAAMFLPNMKLKGRKNLAKPESAPASPPIAPTQPSSSEALVPQVESPKSDKPLDDIVPMTH